MLWAANITTVADAWMQSAVRKSTKDLAVGVIPTPDSSENPATSIVSGARGDYLMKVIRPLHRSWFNPQEKRWPYKKITFYLELDVVSDTEQTAKPMEVR